MYERFFGLDELPFGLTPDPRYFFLSAKHRDALDHLVYGIREGAGFVAITGEIGAGKTTLLRKLLGEEGEVTVYAYVLNPVLSGVELLQEICHELGLPVAEGRREMLGRLNAFLLEQRERGRRVVLVIDEAQALGGSLLEELRMLSNFETEKAKLLQIVLVGQPELREVLARPELRQLDQRIAVRWHLGPLDAGETAQYVEHRLRTASGGRAPRRIFTPRALARVHRETGGVPRLVNLLCHRALLRAYSRDRSLVTSRLVAQAARELREPLSRLPRRGRAWAAAGAVAAAAALALGLALYRARPELAARLGLGGPRRPSVEAAAKTAPAADPASVAAAARAPSPRAGERPVPAAAGHAIQGLTADRLAFRAALEQTSPGQSAYEATEALLRAWGVEPLQPAESAAAALDLPAIAEARGLRYLAVQGNLNTLRVLDLPAVLRVEAPDGSVPRFVAIEALGPDLARVRVGRRELELAPLVVAEAWFGEAHVLWRDVLGLGDLLARGSVGEEVGRLQDLLRRAGVFAGARTSAFGDETEEAVVSYQRRRHLVADGKVGPMTMIALYHDATDEDLPHLTAMAGRRATVASAAGGGAP